MFVHAPVPDALTAAVEGLWLLDMPREHPSEQVLPMPTTELIVNTSDPYVLHDGDRATATPSVFLTGIRSRVITFDNPPRLRHVVVRLPAHGPARFGLPPSSTVTGVQGPLGGALTALAASGLPPERLLDGVTAALVDHLSPESAAQRTVRAASSRLTADPTTPIGRIAESLGVTHKTLIARFRRVTGTTPSRLAHLMMIDRLIGSLPTEGPMPTWTELVADSPYFDQSHFIRSFKQIIGLGPGEYLTALARSRYQDPRFLDAGR